MPWRARDASKHIHGLTGDQANAWAVIANSAMKEYEDEGRAIRVANSQAPRMKRDNGYNASQRKAAANAGLSKRKK